MGWHERSCDAHANKANLKNRILCCCEGAQHAISLIISVADSAKPRRAGRGVLERHNRAAA